jgi:hypothetical protein
VQRSTKLHGNAAWRWAELPSRTRIPRFGQFSQTGGGGGKPEAYVFFLIAGKKQVTAHNLPQLWILPDGGHQAG